MLIATSSSLMQLSPARPKRQPLRAPGRRLQPQASPQVSFLYGSIPHHMVHHGHCPLGSQQCWKRDLCYHDSVRLCCRQGERCASTRHHRGQQAGAVGPRGRVQPPRRSSAGNTHTPSLMCCTWLACLKVMLCTGMPQQDADSTYITDYCLHVQVCQYPVFSTGDREAAIRVLHTVLSCRHWPEHHACLAGMARFCLVL